MSKTKRWQLIEVLRKSEISQVAKSGARSRGKNKKAKKAEARA